MVFAGYVVFHGSKTLDDLEATNGSETGTLMHVEGTR